jgi:hypothetical protein
MIMQCTEKIKIQNRSLNLLEQSLAHMVDIRKLLLYLNVKSYQKDVKIFKIFLFFLRKKKFAKI